MVSMVQGLIGVMIAVLIGVTAVIPTILSSVNATKIVPINETHNATVDVLSGTTKTVLNVLPIILAVAILMGGIALFA